MERILTSKKGERVAALKKLADKPKERRAQGLYLIDGPRLVEDAVNAGVVLRSLLLSEKAAQSARGKALFQRAQNAGAEVLLADDKVLTHITSSPSTQGVLAVAALPDAGAPDAPRMVVSLHGVQDPGNVGGILRSAAAVGADLVLVDRDCADPYSLKAVRGSAGALWLLPVRLEDDSQAALDRLQRHGLRLGACVAAGGMPPDEENLFDPCCFLVGSEGNGLPNEIADRADFRITVQYPGAVESLNASTSVALVLFEALRQRKRHKN